MKEIGENKGKIVKLKGVERVEVHRNFRRKDR